MTRKQDVVRGKMQQRTKPNGLRKMLEKKIFFKNKKVKLKHATRKDHCFES